MATKEKAKSSKSGATKQPASKKGSPSPKPVRPLKASLTSAAVPGMTMELAADALPFNCPAKVYEGIVRLDPNGNRRAFLQTGLHTYLMSIDPDCSGVISSARIDAAFGAFSQNPGNNQPLECNGFLHEDGTTVVLHVVSRNVG
jgi:hypothetical protein